MRTLIALAAASVALSGCAGFNALAGFNSALAPNLKPLSVSVDVGMKCSDLADRMAGADTNQLSSPQLRTLYRACEELKDDYALKLDPQAARKAVDSAIKAASSPASLAGAAVGVAPK